MKRFLRWFVDFLERKFPDKVVVNEALYLELVKQQKETVERQEKIAERIVLLEENLKNINTAMGFSAPKMGVLER